MFRLSECDRKYIFLKVAILFNFTHLNLHFHSKLVFVFVIKIVLIFQIHILPKTRIPILPKKKFIVHTHPANAQLSDNALFVWFFNKNIRSYFIDLNYFVYVLFLEIADFLRENNRFELNEIV